MQTHVFIRNLWRGMNTVLLTFNHRIFFESILLFDIPSLNCRSNFSTCFLCVNRRKWKSAFTDNVSIIIMLSTESLSKPIYMYCNSSREAVIVKTTTLIERIDYKYILRNSHNAASIIININPSIYTYNFSHNAHRMFCWNYANAN